MTAHALLSPSSAHRWMRCPGSVEFSKQFPNKSSQAAEDGTLAHERAAQELTSRLLAKRGETIQLTPVPDDWLPHIEAYVTYCMDLAEGADWIGIEERVTIGHLTGELDPAGNPATGTADFIALRGETLHVCDLKFGQGDLIFSETAGADGDTQINPQTGLYALGALNDLTFLGGVKSVKLHIHQPRRDNVNSVEVSLDYLARFEQSVIRAAERVRDEPNTFAPSTKACHWCPGRAHCSMRANMAMGFAATELNTIHPRDLPDYLKQLDNVRKWCDDIETRALNELRAGAELPGFKLVEGRSTRRWSADAEHALPALLGSDAWRIEKKLITIGDAEKKLGKKHDIFAKITSKPPGAPQVAPESDPRPPLRLDAAVDFSTTSE